MEAVTDPVLAVRPMILLMEDDPAVRRSLQLLLRARGFDVRAHAAGAPLLADDNVGRAACLIADYRVDDIDGIDLLVRLRARHWAAPAILITGYSSDLLRGRATAAGYAIVLDKPIRDHALVEAVDRLTAPRLGADVLMEPITLVK